MTYDDRHPTAPTVVLRLPEPFRPTWGRSTLTVGGSR